MGQRKYSLELRERATRMALEARADPDRSRGAVRRIAEELGIHPEALRTWVRQAEIDRGDRPGTTTDEARRIKELEKEVRELRRANEILRKASAYFAQAECERRWRSSTRSSMTTGRTSGPAPGLRDAGRRRRQDRPERLLRPPQPAAQCQECAR